MRYPVSNFKKDWNTTAGNGFGVSTSYGFHEGVDINLNGGGDSDLGKDIFAIAEGELQYYHTNKHSNSGFGYHNVYKINGDFGTRWVHQAHCMSDLTASVKKVTEGEKIGRVGKSGTVYAHIHFAIFKVDPATLSNGIDTIARTATQLNDWWENPIAFIERWSVTSPAPILPEPNPGYAPTFAGQTVEKNGLIYESYKNSNGNLLWKTRTATPPPAQITEDTLIPQIENRSVRDIKKELLDGRAKINALETKLENVRIAIS